MSSTYAEIDPSEHSRSGPFQNAEPQLIYIQWVPGLVTRVITSEKSELPGEKFTSKDINSINAKPHISNDVDIHPESSRRYKPLLRGLVDVPVKGDQVLLCNIGKINYYFGPLNTENKPNWNKDKLFNFDKYKVPWFNKRNPTTRERLGLSKFFKVSSNSQRMQKEFNNDLDDVKNTNGPEINNDIHGDMLLEGRHGNSIRVGSRSNNPNIIISNSRDSDNPSESLGDGTLIGILSKGTLDQTFPGGYEKKYIEEKIPSFVLADSEAQKGAKERRASEKLISLVNNNISVDSDILYGYDKNQIFQTSDRIILNAKKDSMFFSAFKHLHIGAGRAVTISSNRELVVESSNIYLGSKTDTKIETKSKCHTLDISTNKAVAIESPFIYIGQKDEDDIISKCDFLTLAAKHDIIIGAGYIYLGKSAGQQMVKGNLLQTTLESLISQIISLARIVAAPPDPDSLEKNAAEETITQLVELRDKMLPTILSKRNFTQ